MRYTLFVWSEMLPFSFFFRGGGGGISKLDIPSIGAGSELDISITGSGIPFSDNPRSFPSERPASSRPGSAFPPTLVLRAGAWSSCSAMFTSGWALGVGAKAGSRCSLICQKGPGAVGVANRTGSVVVLADWSCSPSSSAIGRTGSVAVGVATGIGSLSS